MENEDSSLDEKEENEMIIRKGSPQDWKALRVLLSEFDMGTQDFSPEDFLVADAEGHLAGVVFLESVGSDMYLRGMAVHPEWQNRGVGSQLVETLLSGHTSVKLISRGPVTAFYLKMGFHQINWDDIDIQMRSECDACPDRSDCQPVPMLYKNDTEDIL